MRKASGSRASIPICRSQIAREGTGPRPAPGGSTVCSRRCARRGIAPEITQLWGSAGLVAELADRTNAVCVGHLLYGLSPVDADIAQPVHLQPVCTGIKSRLIHVARHARGADLAVGGRYRLADATSVGVIPLGLGDGMPPLRAPVSAEALVRGTRVPVIGVSLEHTVLDLSGVAAPRVGDEVALVGAFGDSAIGLEACAGKLGRSPLELMMSFSGRLAARVARFANSEATPLGIRPVEAVGT